MSYQPNIEATDFGGVFIESTGCCALSQLRVINFNAAKLEACLHEHAVRVLQGSKLGARGGAPTLFCICTPDEHQLSVWLFNNKWLKIGELERRVGYPAGHLEFWIKEFPKC